MKFTDKKYLHLLDVDDNKIYETTIYPSFLGFDESYDDIVLELKINSDDHSMNLIFDNDTITSFNNPINKAFAICQTKRDSMLYLFKKQLLKHPYASDELELIFNKK